MLKKGCVDLINSIAVLFAMLPCVFITMPVLSDRHCQKLTIKIDPFILAKN